MNNIGKLQTVPRVIESDSTSLISQNEKTAEKARGPNLQAQFHKYGIEEQSSTKFKQNSHILQHQFTPQQQLSSSLTIKDNPYQSKNQQSFQNTIIISSQDSLAHSNEDFDIELESEQSQAEQSSQLSSDLTSSMYPSRLDYISSKYLQCFLKAPFKGQPIGITLKRHQISSQAYLSKTERLMLEEKVGIKKTNKKLYKKIHICDVQGTLVSRNDSRRDMSRFAKILEREKNPGFPEARQAYPEDYLTEPNSILPDCAESYYRLSTLSPTLLHSPKVHLNRIVTIKQFQNSQSPSMIRQSPQTYELLQLPKANPSHYFVASQRDYFQLEKVEEAPQSTPPGPQKQQKNQSLDLDSGDFVIISDEDSETLQALDDP